MRKKERSLFDKTGSTVSAVVFWNKEENRFNGVANPKAKVEFSENNFNLFFGNKKQRRANEVGAPQSIARANCGVKNSAGGNRIPRKTSLKKLKTPCWEFFAKMW